MIPAIAPSQDATCCICGTKQSVMPGMEQHHFIPRSLGGTETVLLCVPCHELTEHPDPQKRLVVATTHDCVIGLIAGVTVVKRWFTPVGFDEGLFLQQLEAAPDKLKLASIQFRFLSDDALESAARAMQDMLGASWYCMARLFREAALRSPYGDRRKRLEAFAAQFDLGKSQAYKYIDALEIAEEHDLVHKLDNWTPDALVLLKTAGDPEKAIERYETMHAAQSYTLSQFRADVRREAAPLDPPPAYCALTECQACGARLIPHLEASHAMP